MKSFEMSLIEGCGKRIEVLRSHFMERSRGNVKENMKY